MIFTKNMNKSRIFSVEKLFLLLLFFYVPVVTFGQDKKGQILEEAAKDGVGFYYDNLQRIISKVQKNENYSKEKEAVENLFVDLNSKTVLPDYKIVEGEDLEKSREILDRARASMVSMSTYIFEIEKCSKNLEYKLEESYDYKPIGGDTIQISCKISIKSIECIATFIAKFQFKGNKICSITVDSIVDYKSVSLEEPNLNKSVSVEEPNLYIGAGMKFVNGMNFSIGVDGLSKQWFFNRLRFDVEYNCLFDGLPHYPTALEGTPANMTYIADKDFGFGINVGYRFIPGKYEKSPFRLYGSMGVGCVFYDRWWEYQGVAEPLYHPYSTALYFKPSLSAEYMFSDSWGLGVAADYYVCPEYSRMKGFGLRLLIKFGL